MTRCSEPEPWAAATKSSRPGTAVPSTARTHSSTTPIRKAPRACSSASMPAAPSPPPGHSMPPHACPFIAIELGQECLGEHTGEDGGREGSNVLGLARFRLGSAPPTALVELVRQPQTRPAAIAAAPAPPPPPSPTNAHSPHLPPRPPLHAAPPRPVPGGAGQGAGMGKTPFAGAGPARGGGSGCGGARAWR